MAETMPMDAGHFGGTPYGPKDIKLWAGGGPAGFLAAYGSVDYGDFLAAVMSWQTAEAEQGRMFKVQPGGVQVFRGWALVEQVPGSADDEGWYLTTQAREGDSGAFPITYTGLVPAALPETASDGYHTFKELYEYRLLYNAGFFNELGMSGAGVHKSRLHHDGERPFGGGWFVVVAELPSGQISNHYRDADWDLFGDVPERDRAAKWDGHTPQVAAQRLRAYLLDDFGSPRDDPWAEAVDWAINHVIARDDDDMVRFNAIADGLVTRKEILDQKVTLAELRKRQDAAEQEANNA